MKKSKRSGGSRRSSTSSGNSSSNMPSYNLNDLSPLAKSIYWNFITMSVLIGNRFYESYKFLFFKLFIDF
jgi:hypothetical protein